MIESLQDLVDDPEETLSREYKSWMKPREPIDAANLARHIAAIANHGGGYLVFGFNDDMTPNQNRPGSLDQFSRDEISRIVKRYLLPTFECEVRMVERTKTGETYPVVRIPRAEGVPICSKADGPPDQKGKHQGIRKGTYYTRGPGPESVPIETPEQWRPIIRRCALFERQTLLQAIASLIEGRPTEAPDQAGRLRDWHKRAKARFQDVLDKNPDFKWPIPYEENSYHLGYSIVHDDSVLPTIEDLRSILENVVREGLDLVDTGWDMFFPFHPPEIAPRILTENPDGAGSEILETSLISAPQFETTLPDFWRVSPDGRATIIRGYREDRIGSRYEPGKVLSPLTVVRETAELVRHARGFAERFPSATEVLFRCEWYGLAGREFADLVPGRYWSPGRVASANQRVTEGGWPIAKLGSEWHEVVAVLACPVLRIFQYRDCSPGFVQGMAPRFKRH